MKATLTLTLLAALLATTATAASARSPKQHPTAAEKTAQKLKLNNGNWVEEFYRDLELKGS